MFIAGFYTTLRRTVFSLLLITVTKIHL